MYVLLFFIVLHSCFPACCLFKSNLGWEFETTNKIMCIVYRLPRTGASLTPFLELFSLAIRCFLWFSIVFFAFVRFLDEITEAHDTLDVVIWEIFMEMEYANIVSLYVYTEGLSRPIGITTIIIEKFYASYDGVYGCE